MGPIPQQANFGLTISRFCAKSLMDRRTIRRRWYLLAHRKLYGAGSTSAERVLTNVAKVDCGKWTVRIMIDRHRHPRGTKILLKIVSIVLGRKADPRRYLDFASGGLI